MYDEDIWHSEEVDEGEGDANDRECGDLSCGICWECEDAKAEYMDEKFPEAWKEETESGLDEDDTCVIEECGGWIDIDSEAWTGDVFQCSTCDTEYRYCDTCRGWYFDKLNRCPNDHG